MKPHRRRPDRRPTKRERAIPTPGAPNQAVWICPSPVPLTADDIAAALFCYSDLYSERLHPDRAAVLAEIESIVARVGTAAVEHTAAWLSVHGPDSLPAPEGDGQVWLSPVEADARLTWCQQYADLVLAQEM